MAKGLGGKWAALYLGGCGAGVVRQIPEPSSGGGSTGFQIVKATPHGHSNAAISNLDE